jgi:hypothetical protein
MGLENLPDNTRPPEIFGYKPDNPFDRDMGAKTLGFIDLADLLASGKESDIERLNVLAETFQQNNDQIADWLDNHVKTANAVHELDARIDFLEARISEQAARIRALEARIGIESIDK